MATKVDKLEDELQTEKNQKSKMEKEVQFLKQREIQLQESVDNLKQNLEDVRIAPQSALLSGQIATIELQEKLATLEKENKALKMKGENALNAELVKRQQELEAETTERKRLQESTDLARARCKELEADLDILQNELNRLRGEEAKAGELQTDFRSLRKERDAALEKLGKANSKLEELDSTTK